MLSALRSEHKATNSFPLYHLIYFPLAHFNSYFNQAYRRTTSSRFFALYLKRQQAKRRSLWQAETNGKLSLTNVFCASDKRQQAKWQMSSRQFRHFGQTAAMGNAPGTNGFGTKMNIKYSSAGRSDEKFLSRKRFP